MRSTGQDKTRTLLGSGRLHCSHFSHTFQQKSLFHSTHFLQGFLGGLAECSTGPSADLCHISPGPLLSAPQQAEPMGDFCKQIRGKKLLDISFTAAETHLSTPACWLTQGCSHQVGWDTEAAAPNSFPNTAPATPLGSAHCGTGKGDCHPDEMWHRSMRISSALSSSNPVKPH